MPEHPFILHPLPGRRAHSFVKKRSKRLWKKTLEPHYLSILNLDSADTEAARERYDSHLPPANGRDRDGE